MAGASLEELVEAVGMGLELRGDEEILIERIYLGEQAKLGNAEIRAEVFRRLCLHAGLVRGGQPGRIRIEGGRISGENLNLTGLRLDFGLQFKKVELPRLVLQDTRLLALE